MANPAAYSVSKAGLIQLTKWLSTTLSPEGLELIAYPGGIEKEVNPIHLFQLIKIKLL